MTTREPVQKIPREVQEKMLSRTSPAQQARLLVDLLTSPSATKRDAAYDA